MKARSAGARPSGMNRGKWDVLVWVGNYLAISGIRDTEREAQEASKLEEGKEYGPGRRV